METRVLLLGLDAATLDLIEPWVKEGQLPHFQRLMEMGAWGQLQSTTPPVTAVAWNTFATGKNPGKHGVFDFICRNESYGIRIVNGGDRKTTPFWRILDRHGLRVGVVNMPMTYPPDHLRNGFMISGFDAPGLGSDFVHPPHLKEVLQRRNYEIAPLEKTRESWVKSLFRSFQVQKRAFLELMRTQSWDMLALVFMQLDVAQHLFWRDMEVQEPQFGDVIFELYSEADALIGEMLDELSNDTTLMVISDHGAGPVKKAVSINRWLSQEGYLSFRQKSRFHRLRQSVLLRLFTALKTHLPSNVKTHLKERLGWIRDKAESSLVSSQIDWARTRAFSMGEYGGVFINLCGREAKGVVPEKDYERLRSEIAEKLVGLRDPDEKNPVIRQVYRREVLYSGRYVDQAPDLVLHWDYAYDCRERAGSEHIDVFADEVPYMAFADYRKTGVHRRHGAFFACGPAIQPGRVGNARLIDIAPTLLHLFGFPIPEDFDGDVLTAILHPRWLAEHPITHQARVSDTSWDRVPRYNDDEEKQVKERLRALGYLD